MSKRIAYCADGTWDTSTSHTNVYKLYKALTVGADQMPFYDDGVGASGNPILKLVGGAFGTGLWQKIKDGYTKIAHVYEAGDQVFIFGFSRGAYTARSLAGMIVACGLPTQDFTDDMVNTAFDAYRDKLNRADMPKTLANCNIVNPRDHHGWRLGYGRLTRNPFGHRRHVTPSFMAFLTPACIRVSRMPIRRWRWMRSALSFRQPSGKVRAAPGQTLEQVWFTGAHSDVGGGEPDDLPGTTALSDITLGWMMSKASALGLQFDPASLRAVHHALRSGTRSRQVSRIVEDLLRIPEQAFHRSRHSSIANSVVIRCAEDSSWRPQNLTFAKRLVSPRAIRSSAL